MTNGATSAGVAVWIMGAVFLVTNCHRGNHGWQHLITTLYEYLGVFMHVHVCEDNTGVADLPGAANARKL